MTKTKAPKEITSKRSVQSLLKDARIGYPAAQYELGLRYANGSGGTARNLKQALEWFEAAANKGHTGAQYLLGSAYAGGIGTTKDEMLAHQWFMRSAAQGGDKALLKLSKLHETPQPELAQKYLLASAQAGNAGAQYALAEKLAQATSDQSAIEQAWRWYQQAAEQGHAGALFAQAKLLATQDAEPEILEQARHLYRQASRLGLPAAQLALEQLDEKGLGRDPDSGIKVRTTREKRSPVARWLRYAEQGGADDHFHLALLYESGKTFARSIKHAKHWYGKAAKAGHALAQVALARLNDSSHPEQEIYWYEQAAAQGNEEAHLALGTLYAKGQGLRATPLASLSHFVQAASYGNAQALCSLSSLLNGNSASTASYCIDLAARHGVSTAQAELARRFLSGDEIEKNVSQAFHWYQKAAEQNESEAQYQLACMCTLGLGTPKNPHKAVYWLEQAATQGHLKAQWDLGSLYAIGGNGILRDAKKAMQMCKKSAQSGFAPAQATLGSLFAQAKKHERAIHWWERAAQQQDLEALFNLSNACKFGRGTKADSTRALALMREAAGLGLTAAQVQIGLAYATGAGVPQDTVEACKWFLVASDAGNADAQTNSQHAKARLNQAQFEEAERRAHEWLSAKEKKA